MKQRLRKLLERIRRTPSTQWLRLAPRGRETVAWLPTGRTGWTVHRDVSLRLRNLGVDERGDLPGDAATDDGAFKIRLAGSISR